MKCARCDNEATGYLIQLCDDCFDKFEEETLRGELPPRGELGRIIQEDPEKIMSRKVTRRVDNA